MRAMPRLHIWTWPVVVIALLPGCSAGDRGSRDSVGSAWEDSGNVPILTPFQGKWQFDQQRTYAQMEADGRPKADVDRLRKTYEKMATQKVPPEIEPSLRAGGIDPKQVPIFAGRMHSNLTFQGHVATGDGPVSMEYRLFAVHEHDGSVCAKAWHHEDRFDPGDMSKCYVRLSIVGEELHLRVRIQEGLPQDNDPDLRSPLPVVADSATGCDAEAPAGQGWGEWSTYVFRRPAARKDIGGKDY